MTKADVFAAGAGGNDIANLDIAIGDDHPINEQFHELTLLDKGRAFQTSLNPLAKNLDGRPDASQFFSLLDLTGHLLGLALEDA